MRDSALQLLQVFIHLPIHGSSVCKVRVREIELAVWGCLKHTGSMHVRPQCREHPRWVRILKVGLVEDVGCQETVRALKSRWRSTLFGEVVQGLRCGPMEEGIFSTKKLILFFLWVRVHAALTCPSKGGQHRPRLRGRAGPPPVQSGAGLRLRGWAGPGPPPAQSRAGLRLGGRPGAGPPLHIQPTWVPS
jgi:hypothetical protein